jgi:hypothetical protein
MSTKIDRSASPYFDDWQDSKNFHQVLFRPEYYVQTRELNQLQTILQKQIEKFGDNVFKNGTIVSGCNFNFFNKYAYVKLSDITTDNEIVTPSDYVGLYATNQFNVKAYIKNYRDGYQSTDPDLKTIYIDYISQGVNAVTFASGDSIKITNQWESLYSVSVGSSGSGYSNSDQLVIVPAVAVMITSGPGFSVGEYVSQSNISTRALVTSVNSTMYSDRVVVFLQPTTADLSNASLSTTPWNFVNNYTITGNTSGTLGTVIDTFGHSANGQIVTDESGGIAQVVIENIGKNYRVVPYATVKSSNSSAVSSGLVLTPKNYLHTITIPAVSNATGVGYAMEVTEGVIYKDGYFVRTDKQTIVVEPYSPSPNNISVIFDTNELLITPEIDDTLYDNALGSPNYTAPGAHRLKITANLAIVNTDIATNSASLILTSFSEGLPFKQNIYTQFNSITEEMARRTSDESGDYVLDRFNVTTRSPLDANSANVVSLIVDPGKAYISGYKVETQTNYQQSINKGVDVSTSNGTIVSLDYQNYLKLNEVGGVFQFNIGDTVSLYDTTKRFISNTSLSLTGNTTPVGNVIGTASMRSLVLESGVPGTNSAIYRLYLFNVTTAVGKNIKDARSVGYSSGGLTGVGDIVLTKSTTTNTDIATLYGNNSALVFSPQVGNIKQVANVTYTYRTINATAAAANDGTLTVSLVSNPNETFPYSGNLSNVQMTDLYVVPLANNMLHSNALTGTVTINTTSANIVGVGTSFLSTLTPGDYLWIANSTANTYKKVISVANDTVAVLEANSSIALSAVNHYRYFPRGVPVPFGSRSYLTANVNANGAILTLNFGNTFNTTTSSNVAIGYNAKRSNVTPGTKTANRTRHVKIYTGNNEGSTVGPWCLGTPDIVRLRGVYISNSSSNTTSPGTANDISESFFIDHNHSEDIAGLGYLYKNPSSRLSINATTYILVEFDCMTVSSAGFYATESYTTANSNTIFATDVLPVANLSNVASTWEIPEFNTNTNKYYDMMKYLDFRPIVTPTANIASLTLNPAYANAFSTSTDLKFPLPGSTLTGDITYYKSRIDLITVDKNGSINAISGTPSIINPITPKVPRDSLSIDQLFIPAYPTLPTYPSSNIVNAVTTFVGTTRPLNTRVTNSRIFSVMTRAPSIDPQVKGYKMADIANLERRIKALEYYVNLNSLETLIAQQSIPSSISQSVNRFKYGFYADDFSTFAFADIKNPEFAATIYPDRARAFPKSEIIPINHQNGQNNFPDFDETLVLSQNNATVPIVNNVPNNQPCVLDSNVSFIQMEGGDNWARGGNSSNINIRRLRMSDFSSNVTLYFYEIHDATSPTLNITITTNTGGLIANISNFTAISNVEYAYLKDKSIYSATSPQFKDLLNSNNTTYSTGGWGGFGKIEFTHNPSVTKEYLITVTGQQWGYIIKYPINSTDYVDCQNQGGGAPVPVVINEDDIIPDVIPPMPINTVGGITAANNGNSPAYIWGDGDGMGMPRVIRLSIYASKPNFPFALYLDNNDYSSLCKPYGKNLGDPLISDKDGWLFFDYYHPGTTNYLDEQYSIPAAFQNANWFFATATSAPQGTNVQDLAQYVEYIGKNLYHDKDGYSLQNVKVIAILPLNTNEAILSQDVRWGLLRG